MTSPLVLTYLRDHSLAELFAEHGVRVSLASGPSSYKASFNYDQIAARNDDPIAAQCRGLVLATIDGTPFPQSGPCGDLIVLARPMDRFFNLGHGPGGSADVRDEDLAHPDARVYEKLDGTLCIVYFDMFRQVSPGNTLGCVQIAPVYGGWCVATRSVPDADRVIDGFGDHTFRSLFEQALEDNGRTFAELTSQLSPRYTYCFELTSPRAGSGVVSQDRNHTWLLAVRHTATGRELCPSELDGIRSAVADESAPPTAQGFNIAPHHALGSLSALRELVEARSPRDAEGVVVRLAERLPCGRYQRVKVKSLAYTAAHALSGDAASSPRNLLRIILTDKWDDVRVTVKPHLREHGDALASGLAVWLARIDAEFKRIMQETAAPEDGKARKAFALAVQAAKLPIAPMMAIWTAQVDTARAWVDAARREDGEWGDAFLDNLAAWISAEST